MRTFAILLLGAFVFQPVLAQPPKALKKFTRAFQKISKSNVYEDYMPFFDAAYVKEQHDGMLEGRTRQFITEFLAGTLEGSGEYYVPEGLEEVKKIKVRIGAQRSDGGWSIILQVINHDGKKYRHETQAVPLPEEWLPESWYAYGFVGAFG